MSMSKWQILVIDNSDITIAGLCSFLHQMNSVKTTDAAASFKVALDLYNKNDYDLIILNLCLYNYAGFDFLERLTKLKPKTNILTFSNSCIFIYALKALKIGAKGYFASDISGDDFIKAAEQVAHGEKYLDRELAQKIALHLIHDEPHPFLQLTTREFEVLRLFAKGLGNHQIAALLHVGYKTVCNYVSKIKEKLNVHNNMQLVCLCREHGLISDDYILTAE